MVWMKRSTLPLALVALDAFGWLQRSEAFYACLSKKPALRALGRPTVWTVSRPVSLFCRGWNAVV
jgi:hypothetical protein